MKLGCYRITPVQAVPANADRIIPELRPGIADGIYVNSGGAWLGVVQPSNPDSLAGIVGQEYSVLPYWDDEGGYILAADVSIGEYLGKH